MNPPPRLSRLWWVTGPALALIVVAVLVAGSMRVPYVILSPGSARSVVPLVTVSEKPGGPPVTEDEASDDLLYVTVSSTVEPSGFWTLWGWMDDRSQVEPSKPFLGQNTDEENRKLNLALMTDSQEKARVVALERLGYEVTKTPVGAFLEDVDPSYPAADVLKPGMTVVGADGEPVTTVDELVDAIRAHEPGDEMDLSIIPLEGGRPQTVTAEVGTREGDPGVPALGVTPVDRNSYGFPMDIRIDTGKVGGPSAGLAFTLAILDRLTPGSLTGGDRMAVTGTIELDGTVGPVGGVDHKTEAAIDEGAKVFLVPPEEFEQAKEAARGRIEIEQVRSLDEAIAALVAHGGDPLPTETK
ncbi:MAG: putative secreted protein containing a domain [Ilumatobacteraceae bacterium]|nr:putative secreted protein containing a domain [Ilumatobacteraceae bacterium]